MKKKILITGGAGFIGFHLAKMLLDKNSNIVILDDINNYYSTKLKNDRLQELKKKKVKFKFYKTKIEKISDLKKIFKKEKFDIVIHLAAQAGVRYSIENPRSYIDRNVIGFFNILECVKNFKIKHLLFASTSSVYGDCKNYPIDENQTITKPIQLYAATKGSNELMAYAYAKMFDIKITGMRFFTVYGPWGRPDMSLYIFAKKISERKKISLFNKGNHVRDFTYVDDVVNGIQKILKRKIIKKQNYEVFNIGNGRPVNLKSFLREIEKNLNIKAQIYEKPLQKGDIFKTHASIKKISKDLNYKSKINYKEGVRRFIKWFKEYHNV